MNKIIYYIKLYLPLFLQMCRFGIVGLLAAGVHISIVFYLVQYQELAPLVANLFGFLFGFQISYWGHRLWTFNYTSGSHRDLISKLLVVQVINMVANETLFSVFLSFHIPYLVALLIVLTILPFFTFISSKMWVFR